MGTPIIIQPDSEYIQLPTPSHEGGSSLEAVLQQRRSVRNFSSQDLTLEQLSQLLWACQGITDSSGLRTTPSAGATYPLEVFTVLPNGVFHYQPETHSVQRTNPADIRPELCQAALDQDFIRKAAGVIILAAVHQRTMVRYGNRTTRYVLMEVGHAAQNLILQCTSLGLGAVPVGAFEDEAVSRLLNLPPEATLWYLIAVGYPTNAR